MIRLTQEEYNRLCEIEDYSLELVKFLNEVHKIDWSANRDDNRYSRALYCLIVLERNLVKQSMEG